MYINHSMIKPGLILLGTLSGLVITSQCHAADNPWQWKGTADGYYQNYQNSTERKSSYNAGVYLSGDYHDSANITLGYHYTHTDFSPNAELDEQLFYLSGRHHYYLDQLPGKLTARFDLYLGRDTLSYPSGATPPTIHGSHHSGATGGAATVKESTNIYTLNPQVSYLNYAKTFYADIGFAYTKYDDVDNVQVSQLSPALGFGWNESYDWLQLRGYLIKVKNAGSAFNDDQFNSLEAAYTHWFAGDKMGKLEFVRFSAMAGHRVLAVDPDAAVLYSSADIQTGAYSTSAQWALSKTRKIMALVSYGRYRNDAIGDQYNSLLFYLNLQQQL